MVVKTVYGKKSSLKGCFLVLQCCVAVVIAGAVQAQEQTMPVSYSEQVQPLFDRYCVECHSGWFPQGGLRLNSLENLREGGSNGVVLFAGKADKGKLINMIRIVPGRFTIMPPGPTAVTAEQFELIRRWIEQGAN